MPRPLSAATGLVLDAMARGCRHGFDILDATGLPSGTVYPILRRLEDDGLATSKWEPADRAHEALRPPRRYYELTAAGRERVAEARSRFPFLATTRPRRA